MIYYSWSIFWQQFSVKYRKQKIKFNDRILPNAAAFLYFKYLFLKCPFLYRKQAQYQYNKLWTFWSVYLQKARATTARFPSEAKLYGW